MTDIKKKERSYTQSVRVPFKYEKLMHRAKKYLFAHPGVVQKSPEKIIYDSDVFRWGLDMIWDFLDENAPVENGFDISIIGDDPVAKEGFKAFMKDWKERNNLET